MTNHAKTYASEAEQYEALISREDYQQNILPAIEKICNPAGLEIADLGAGTGRLICLLAPLAKHIWGFEPSQHMLDVAEAKLRKAGLNNWTLGVADHDKIPLADSSVDLAVGGWALCYASARDGSDSTPQLDQAFSEIDRVVRPGGSVILLDTLGTGYEEPHPLPKLQEYYDYLNSHGFSSTWIRTDYQFDSVEEAVILTRFFFGDALAEELEKKNYSILPECTGVWWKKQRIG